MKKCKLCISMITSALLLSSCGNTISAEDYETVTAEVASLQSEIESLSDENKKINDSIDALQSEYDAYKEKMQPYENLEAAEAEARQIEADKIIAEQKAAEEAAAAEAAALLAEEEAKGYETGITYDNIARTPNDFLGKKVKFTGKVVQLIEGSNSIQIRLAINSNYDQIVLCEYTPSIVESRVLEDDIITIYGISVGTISYQSTIGGQITVPAISIDRIDQ
ncbi:MAG: toxin regulator [Lachnospiraceae bacterium]|nr:toxin regulator [Lachnospiraceae bacterium]MCM1235496.1 toxin regulator [Ruminococcus flavefaciens]